MSLGNPTPVAGQNAANAASAATAPSSAGGGRNPFGGGLDGLTDALGGAGFQTQQLFGQQPQSYNIPSAQPSNNVATPIDGGAQAPPLNVAPPAPVAQNGIAPVAPPISTSAQAPASVTAGSTISSMMQPVGAPVQQPAPVNSTSFAPAAQVPQNQTAAPTSTDPTSFLGGAQSPVALQNVQPLLNNPAGF